MRMDFFYRLVRPKSKTEDSRRHEFILNFLLISIIALLIVAGLLTLTKRLDPNFDKENSIPLITILGSLSFFLILYHLSRKGYFKFSAYLLTGALLILSSYMIYLWGVEVQAPLLFFSLIIVLSGILISSKYAFLISFISSVILVIAFYLQKINFYQPNLCWKDQPWGIIEILTISVVFLVIAAISWLSNREIEKSLERAKKSEKALAKQKDLLEIRVEERTRELQKAQMEKLDSLTKMAEFGNISSGLFHDFISPLTALKLNIDQIKKTKSQKEKIKTNLKQASQSTKKMTALINSFRKQISDHNIKKNFSINKEIKEVIDLLDFQAKNNKVKILFKEKSKIKTYGNPIKLNQILTNLISNAIDSYPKKNNLNQEVIVKLEECNKNIVILVSDNGKGISERIQSKIFDPFFTTKGFGQGSGVGLSLTKNVLEKEFNGNINLTSKKNQGTTFIIKFKRKQNNDI